MLQLRLGRSCAKGWIGTNGARNLEGVEGTKRAQRQQLEHELGPIAMLCCTTSCPCRAPGAVVQPRMEICPGSGMGAQWDVCQISQGTWWEDFSGIRLLRWCCAS